MYSKKNTENMIHLAAIKQEGVTLSAEQARAVSDLLNVAGSHVQGGASTHALAEALFVLERLGAE